MGRKPTMCSLKKQSFFKVLLGDFSKHLDIPKSIVMTEGLESKKTVEIEDSTGTLWPVKLTSTTNKGHLAMYMSSGWGKCSKANKIVVGDTVVFEFVQQSVWRLHVFKRVLGTGDGGDRPIYVVLDAPNINY